MLIFNIVLTITIIIKNQFLLKAIKIEYILVRLCIFLKKIRISQAWKNYLLMKIVLNIYLYKLKNLTIISFSSNKIKDILRKMAHIVSLKELCIYDNPICLYSSSYNIIIIYF